VISPVPLAALRCAVAALVLLGVMAVAAPAWRRPSPAEWATLVLLGLVGNTLFQLGMVGGLRFTTPAHSALMIALNPVFTALLARVWLGERLTARRALGIGLAFGGVAVILAPGAGPAADATLLGDLLSLGAAVAWAVYSVAGKPLLATRPSLEVTTLAMVIGAVPLLPVGLPGLLRVPWVDLGLGTWALLGYLSVVSLVVAYLLWYWALARAATRAGRRVLVPHPRRGRSALGRDRAGAADGRPRHRRPRRHRGGRARPVRVSRTTD